MAYLGPCNTSLYATIKATHFVSPNAIRFRCIRGRGHDMALAPLVAGNWKMNGLTASIGELDRIIAGGRALTNKVELLVCPPATLVPAFAARARDSGVRIGGQDCHWEDSGAFTGDISAPMLADAGALAVIVGHSERRLGHQ